MQSRFTKANAFNRFCLSTNALGLLILLCSATTAVSADRPNVLLICVDDLRPELACFGKDYIHSPNIDALASDGTIFTRHYVQAPTCGASRNALLTGLYGGASNGALFQRAERIAEGKQVPPSMPAWFRENGYTTVSVGKVSHHPGGRGGPDWDDEAKPEMPNSWDRHLLPAGAWQHPRGWMHGLANGEIRKNAKDMDVFQSLEGKDDTYPDGVSTDEALRQLALLVDDDSKPFFFAFGILRPHLPFGAPAKYMTHYQDILLPEVTNSGKPSFRTTWHGSGEFMKYNRWKRNPNEDPEFAILVRKHYAACVSYADAQVGRIIKQLKAHKLYDNTIIVLWGDHGWHLGEHAIWGKHALFEESLRSPLIIRSELTAKKTVREDVVESIDVFPTLCDLAGLAKPSFLKGDSLAATEDAVESSSGEAVSYFKNAKTLRTNQYRLISHKDGYFELYDHLKSPGETINIAEENEGLIEQLAKRLADKLE